MSPSTRYRYRLTAANSFGVDSSDPRLFGPPLIVSVDSAGAGFTEATLGASLDPSGLETTYFFEYGTSDAYGSKTAEATVDGEAPLGIEGHLFGLLPGTAYHVRLVASSSVETVAGPDQTFTTLTEVPVPKCPNDELRTGLGRLPDCRAYELVTPDTNGIRPVSLLGTEGEGNSIFDTWLATPDGGSLIFDTAGSLPGTPGNGAADRYRVVREPGGWSSGIVSPSGVQTERPGVGGVSIDHGCTFGAVAGRAGASTWVAPAPAIWRHPDGGFELIGIGSLGLTPGPKGAGSARPPRT